MLILMLGLRTHISWAVPSPIWKISYSRFNDPKTFLPHQFTEPCMCSVRPVFAARLLLALFLALPCGISFVLGGAYLYDLHSGWWRGSQKSWQKERHCVNSICDKGGGGHTMRKFCGRHISIAPWTDYSCRTQTLIAQFRSNRCRSVGSQSRTSARLRTQCPSLPEQGWGKVPHLRN